MRSLIAFIIMAGAAAAQEAELPPFKHCFDREAERYEWRLRIHQGRDLDAADFDLWHTRGVEYCGNIGVTRCDRTGDPIPCQEALIAEQDALRDAVVAGLPAPGDRSDLPGQLYARVHALAHGRSAGPDCAGARELLATWCEAREANLRLQNAVLAWQVGRWLGVTEPALVVGWADPARPVRPRGRPEQ